MHRIIGSLSYLQEEQNLSFHDIAKFLLRGLLTHTIQPELMSTHARTEP